MLFRSSRMRRADHYWDQGGAVPASTEPDLQVRWCLDLLDPTQDEPDFVDSRAKVRVPPREL
jgi:hypothetical protein